MKLVSIALCLSLAATTAMFGCGSSTSTGTGTGADATTGGAGGSGTGLGTPIICLQPGAEGELCAINAPSTAALKSDCAEAGGTIVTSCSTTGLVGCCTTKLPGMFNEVCHYGGTASQQEASCSPGTWSTTP